MPSGTQQKNLGGEAIGARLRRYQVSQGLTWRRVGENLGISLSMVMMVLRGERNLSAKALFRLAEAEQEADKQRSTGKQVVESLIGESSMVTKVLGRAKQGQSPRNVAVDYIVQRPKVRLPAVVSLTAPSEEACRKLRVLFAETLDTRLIALACLPEELRTEDYFDRLSAESKTRLTSAALGLVIRDWRMLAVRGVLNPAA